MKEIDSCPFEEPVGDYKIAPGKKKKTRFEKITESPTSLAYFLMDVRCDVGHYKYDEYPPTALAMFLDQAVFQSFGLYSNFHDDIDSEYGYERNHFEEREDAILAWLKQEA